MTVPVHRALSGRIAISLAQDVALISMVTVFAYIHARLVIVEHTYSALPFALLNATYAVLFLTRRRSRSTSTRWQDWLVAAVGGWLPFAFQPGEAASGSLAVSGTAIQAFGLLLACVCLTSLGRSFGIVAANRGLKTHGVYSFVRHPVYLAHLVTDTGFLLANPAWLNVGLLTVIVTAQVLRIRAEERVLGASSDYASYKSRVRFRLVPGLY